MKNPKFTGHLLVCPTITFILAFKWTLGIAESPFSIQKSSIGIDLRRAPWPNSSWFPIHCTFLVFDPMCELKGKDALHARAGTSLSEAVT